MTIHKRIQKSPQCIGRGYRTAATMKLLLLATGFLLAVSATPIDEWNKYKAEHNKVYTSKEENERRLERYLKNKEMVEEHNRKYERGETSYTMGLNHFSDWFPEEIDKMLGLKLDENRPQGGQTFELPPGTSVPDSINWVKKGAVTSVKYQGDCGSSYAFSAVGALEGLMFTTNNTITDLSAQELVDCSGQYGCEGGLPAICFAYVQNRGGIDTDQSYPYEAEFKTCRAANGTIGATCTGFSFEYGEDYLKLAVGTVGPISIGFAMADSFVHYKSGIFDGDCADEPNHGMLAVGYDTDEKTKKDYWLVKNSWGTDWGEKGFARIRRGIDKCQIGMSFSYPIYKK